MTNLTKESLEAYRSKKEEIKELQNKLLSIADGKPMIDSDTILDYRKGYPVPQAVVGVDWDKIERTEERYEKKISALTKECEKIEDFIESISDSLTRRIFRMYYIEGMSQKNIANIVHMDRSNVGKKINAFYKKEKR